MQRFRSGLVFKAHRLLYHSTLGLGASKKKKDAMRRSLPRMACKSLAPSWGGWAVSYERGTPVGRSRSPTRGTNTRSLGLPPPPPFRPFLLLCTSLFFSELSGPGPDEPLRRETAVLRSGVWVWGAGLILRPPPRTANRTMRR